jgi:hypothetical protein
MAGPFLLRGDLSRLDRAEFRGYNKGMSTPVEALKSIRSPLLELHKLLLETLKQEREQETGRAMAPAEWFQVLISAPEFAWTKPLNTLISDVDALSEVANIRSVDLSILHHQLNALFFSDNEDVTTFNSHYRKLLPKNHHLVYAHGQIKEATAILPLETLPMNSDEIRLSWHKICASKRKLLN